MHLPAVFTALAVSLALAFLLADGWVEIALFLAAGLGGGAVALAMPRGAEAPYWLFVLLIIALVALNLAGTEISRFAFILPIVFIAAYFTARLTRKIARLAGAK